LSLKRLDTVLLAFGYGAVIIWVCDKARARLLLAWAAPLGRMAFTNYVMQSVVFGWLFYGYGLGLFAKVGVATRRWLSAPPSMPHRPSSVRTGCFTIASDRWNGYGAVRCTGRGSRF